MRPADNTHKLFKKLRLKASAQLDERVHGDIWKALEERGRTRTVLTEPNVWRIIMQSRITKVAVAAVIIIAVILGLNIIGGPDMASVAWADVVKNIEQIQTSIARTKTR
ncbi:MAG: hypothetical protein ACYTEQ_24425, partial [Planctomycetota bacterium]